MKTRDGSVVRLTPHEPAMTRVRAAVLAAVAAPGGCSRDDLMSAVCAALAVDSDQALARRIERALGLLFVTGHVDELGGRLVIRFGLSAAV